MNLKVLFLTTIFSCISTLPIIHSQESMEDFPSWLLLEYGKKAFDQGEYGKALQLFRDSIEKQSSYPEAEMWIGEVYRAEGEYDLAERHYLKAYDLKNLLYIPEERYSILYKLAEVYYFGGRFKKYEEALQLVVKEDVRFGERNNEIPYLLAKNVRENGMDKTLTLYRVSGQFSLEAHGKLGIFYYRTGRYDRALIHLTYATVIVSSRMLEELKRQDPDFQFQTLDAGFALVPHTTPLGVYIAQTGVFEVIYYLGAVLFTQNDAARASELWNIVVKRAPAGSVKDKAARQLRSPFVEPLIDFGRY